MLPYVTELLGTMVLILLSDDVVANVTLSKSGMEGAGFIRITSARGPAIMLPAFIFGAASGTHFNPILTIALVVDGSLVWALAPRYIVAQFADAFAGTVLVYLPFKDRFDITGSAATELDVLSTGPSVPNMRCNILNEATGTLVFVSVTKGIGQVAGIPAGVGKLLVFGIVVSIGMSLGGLTGYVINPTHDLGPRIAHVALPIKGKGNPNRGHAPIVIVGPVVGAVVAALLYQAILWA